MKFEQLTPGILMIHAKSARYFVLGWRGRKTRPGEEHSSSPAFDYWIGPTVDQPLLFKECQLAEPIDLLWRRREDIWFLTGSGDLILTPIADPILDRTESAASQCLLLTVGEQSCYFEFHVPTPGDYAAASLAKEFSGVVFSRPTPAVELDEDFDFQSLDDDEF